MLPGGQQRLSPNTQNNEPLPKGFKNGKPGDATRDCSNESQKGHEDEIDAWCKLIKEFLMTQDDHSMTLAALGAQVKRPRELPPKFKLITALRSRQNIFNITSSNGTHTATLVQS